MRFVHYKAWKVTRNEFVKVCRRSALIFRAHRNGHRDFGLLYYANSLKSNDKCLLMHFCFHQAYKKQPHFWGGLVLCLSSVSCTIFTFCLRRMKWCFHSSLQSTSLNLATTLNWLYSCFYSILLLLNAIMNNILLLMGIWLFRLSTYVMNILVYLLIFWYVL